MPRDLTPEQIQLVYITGRGHSGSTLPDLLLSAHCEVVSVGEAKCLVTRPDEPCTCGAATVFECPFWEKVDAALREKAGLRLREIGIDSGDADTFAAHNRAFSEAVTAVTGKRIIVDSSKNVDRLENLLEADVFPVVSIHLVRSPFGVVYSNSKRGRDWLYHAYNYTYAMMKTRRLLEGRDHLQITYEQMVRDPRDAVERIMGRLGLALQPEQLDWARPERHNIYGNPMRFATDNTIRLDTKWRKGLSLRQKLVIWWLTLPCRFEGTAYYLSSLQAAVRAGGPAEVVVPEAEGVGQAPEAPGPLVVPGRPGGIALTLRPARRRSTSSGDRARPRRGPSGAGALLH